ncbi:MAG: hypothetical protein ACLGIV_10425 [Actinomycetes bacterium]
MTSHRVTHHGDGNWSAPGNAVTTLVAALADQAGRGEVYVDKPARRDAVRRVAAGRAERAVGLRVRLRRG